MDQGADVHARRGDGRTAWVLARRFGFDDFAGLLEDAGAVPEDLGPADALLAASSRGDAAAARRLASPALVASLDPEGARLLPEAASRRRLDVVRACLAGGFPVDAADEFGAIALHHASIRGAASIVRDLLGRGADFRIRDSQHRSTPIEWACFGGDEVAEPGGDYEDCGRALLDAGARLSRDEEPEHAGVREVLRAHAGGVQSQKPWE